jgi:hypothetical protein
MRANVLTSIDSKPQHVKQPTTIPEIVVKKPFTQLKFCIQPTHFDHITALSVGNLQVRNLPIMYRNLNNYMIYIHLTLLMELKSNTIYTALLYTDNMFIYFHTNYYCNYCLCCICRITLSFRGPRHGEYMEGNVFIKLNSKTSNAERALLTITTSFEVNDDRNFFLQIYTDYQTQLDIIIPS